MKYFREGDGAEELYDLKEDPRETRNLIEARPEDVKRLRALMDELRKERSAGGELVVPELDEDTRKKLESLGYIQ